MSIGRNLLLRMFGRPRGLLGRLGGVVMARGNRRHAIWVVDLLDVQRHDRVLEIGFGPGVAIELLASSAQHVAGIDPSPAMLRQAMKRNTAAIGNGRVDLRQATADQLPFADASFDKAMSINSMQVWPDVSAGLRETWRVLKPGGRVALAFTAYSGQSRQGVPDLVMAAGFTDCSLVETDQAFCVLATSSNDDPATSHRRSTAVTLSAEEIYRSSNGDRWRLMRDPGSGRVFVRHEANLSSGGRVTDTDVDEFLSVDGPGPEFAALRRVLSRPAQDG